MYTETVISAVAILGAVVLLVQQRVAIRRYEQCLCDIALGRLKVEVDGSNINVTKIGD
jgi:hypothetical protein